MIDNEVKRTKFSSFFINCAFYLHLLVYNHVDGCQIGKNKTMRASKKGYNSNKTKREKDML